MQKQNTLAASFSLQGKGLHSGLNIEVSFNPAPENHGYKIKRVDLPEQPVIDAVAENVINTQRGTVIGRKDIQISTIEHAMAALYAMGVDNPPLCGRDTESRTSGTKCSKGLLYRQAQS